MTIDSKTQRDIEFTRSVLENLEEPERAARMARAMIERYSTRPNSQEIVNAYRNILINAMRDAPRERQAEEFQKLFEGYLIIKDRISAANLLMEMATICDGEDSFEAANKCIELFRDSNETEISKIVDTAFNFRDCLSSGFYSEDDPKLKSNYLDYANWLLRAPLPASELVKNIIHASEYIDSAEWLPIACNLLDAKNDILSEKDYYRLQIRIMWNYEELEKFDAALDTGFKLLKRGFSESEERAETLLSLGTCFLATEEYHTARMFLHEARDLLIADSGHWVWKMATDALDEIEGALDDIDDA